MDKFSFLLVFISIFTHAYWNFLTKSSCNKHIFIAFSKIAEVVIFALPAVYFLAEASLGPFVLVLISVAAFITFLNYYFLSNAYRHGDLSLTYPVSRSSILFLPLLSYIFIDERVSALGLAAIFLIMAGTLVMHLDSFGKKGWNGLLGNFNNPATGYALLAAFTVAAYTLWDKIALRTMSPFLYFYLYTLIIALLYGLFSFTRFPRQEVKAEWKTNKWKIIQVGFFNSFTYLLVLVALTMSKVSYVGGIRQLSVVVGAFLGYKFLNEKMNAPKMAGIGISILGGALIYFAR